MPRSRAASRSPFTLAVGLLAATALLVLSAACSSTSSSSGGSTTAPGTTPGSTPGTGTTPGTVLGDNPAVSAFYQPPSPLPAGKPGDIIRSQPLAGAPAGSQAWLVLYHSQGFNNEDIAVSGMVFAPTGAAPAGGRPVVSWAHPTTGVADQCAPSSLSTGPALVAGLAGFLNAGYVVAATDYEGLGTPGIHPYLIGISEGRGVLDAARAAKNLTETGASSTVFTWGHSQGGQASLFAGQLAPTYAPDLQVKGVAAAAPAGDLAQQFQDDLNTADGIILGGWAMNAYQQLYGPTTPGLNIDQMITPAGQTALDQFEDLCNVIPEQEAQIGTIIAPVMNTFWATSNPGSVPPWTQLLQQNTPGATKTPAPIFIAQDTGDTVVVPATTTQLAKDLCTTGDTVNLKVYPGLSHDVIGYESAPDALAWMQSISAGQPAPTTCGS
jgi:alpha-beta hydrolase superfamily lysophospholipase